MIYNFSIMYFCMQSCIYFHLNTPDLIIRNKMKTETKWKDNPWNGRKFLQTKQLKRINHQHIQTPHLAPCQKKKKMTQWRNGQKIFIDIYPKKIYRWPKGTWKDTQPHWSLKKCKLKLQWGIISHWSEWPSSKSLQTVNAGEDMKKRQPSYAVGGNTIWYNH